MGFWKRNSDLIIRELALRTSEKLTEIISPAFTQWAQSEKVAAFIDFFKESQALLKTHYTKTSVGVNLTSNELTYLKCQFNGLCPHEILNELNRSEDQLRKLKHKLFVKFEARHWFECFRKALALDIIKLGDVLQKSPYSIATAEIQNILEHLGHRPITRNKLQLELYEGLLKFYCSLTYDCLLHPAKTAKL